MRLQFYKVDAFTGKLFSGNPAAVCPLSDWLPDDLMQRIARENSVAETAFFVPVKNGFALRWFTPEIEMDLCGHATLAAAHVIARHLHPSTAALKFYTKSGELTVIAGERMLSMDFPSRKPLPATAPQIILDAFPYKPKEILHDRDYLLVFENEAMIRNMRLDRLLLDQINLDPGGICITAKGNEADFVSRFFTPQASIFEDPVTGSAHCSLIPYWSEKLGKDAMIALQFSPRGGKLICTNAGDRVRIAGEAVTYLIGWIEI